MKNDAVRVRRVGSITFGCVLIAVGIVFLMHLFWPYLAYQRILCFWPLILILLGIEVLISCKKTYSQTKSGVPGREPSKEGAAIVRQESEIRYDFAAIFMTALLIFFAMAMAVLDFFFRLTVHGL